MAGEREHITVPGGYVHGNVSDRLNGVGVEEHTSLPGDGGDLGDGLDGADLVIGGHDGDEDGVGADGRLYRLRVHTAQGIHRQVGDRKALGLFQVLQGVQDGVMLNGGGDDVPALAAPELGHGLEGPVVALRPAGGEEDLLGLCVQAPGDLCPRGIQIGLGLLAECIEAGGIPIGVPKIGHHGLQRPGRERGGSGVIGIEKTGHTDSSFQEHKLLNSYRITMIMNYKPCPTTCQEVKRKKTGEQPLPPAG